MAGNLHLRVVIAQEHDSVGIGKIGYMDDGSKLNSGVILQGAVENPVDGVIEEGGSTHSC